MRMTALAALSSLKLMMSSTKNKHEYASVNASSTFFQVAFVWVSGVMNIKYIASHKYLYISLETYNWKLYTEPIMSPLGIQRTIAIIIFASPWVFIPGVFKDIVFIVAGIFLFVSTLDLKRRQRATYEDHHEETVSEAPTVA